MILNTQNFGRGVWDGEALPRLLRLGQIIEQEQAIAYTLSDLDGLSRQKYPGYRPITDWSREYDLWTRTTLDRSAARSAPSASTPRILRPSKAASGRSRR